MCQYPNCCEVTLLMLAMTTNCMCLFITTANLRVSVSCGCNTTSWHQLLEGLHWANDSYNTHFIDTSLAQCVLFCSLSLTHFTGDIKTHTIRSATALLS
ncbi:hypothetical protein NP493_4159g00000 [Ridgeia piscesae]|uniref:Uncharacterized protein n=1 Tax=Ridgeia piscesae TaxID=27915 RepID=A0AAD9J1H6_RIDPI|nr:hypothetical protein NP493_4159g00000 [Ridgeia piscesae]